MTSIVHLLFIWSHDIYCILERDPPLSFILPVKEFFLFLGSCSWSDVRSKVKGQGCRMCPDSKALWGKFVICDIGRYKINWTELFVSVFFFHSRVSLGSLGSLGSHLLGYDALAAERTITTATTWRDCSSAACGRCGRDLITEWTFLGSIYTGGSHGSPACNPDQSQRGGEQRSRIHTCLPNFNER